MKLEQISLRTGFLLALAGWAAAVWLATGFGLGSGLICWVAANRRPAPRCASPVCC